MWFITEDKENQFCSPICGIIPFIFLTSAITAEEASVTISDIRILRTIRSNSFFNPNTSMLVETPRFSFIYHDQVHNDIHKLLHEHIHKYFALCLGESFLPSPQRIVLSPSNTCHTVSFIFVQNCSITGMAHLFCTRINVDLEIIFSPRNLQKRENFS